MKRAGAANTRQQYSWRLLHVAAAELVAVGLAAAEPVVVGPAVELAAVAVPVVGPAVVAAVLVVAVQRRQLLRQPPIAVDDVG